MNQKFYINFSVLVLVIFFCNSCILRKNIQYLQPRSDSLLTEEFPINPNATEYKIEKGDILSIQVNSTVATDIDIIDKKFKEDKSSGGDQLYGYDVDQEGNISLPLLGKIKIDGLTLTQASDTLQKFFESYIKYVTIKVKLKEIRFTILGEVNSPGQKTTNYSKVSIFNAIGIAGDLTYYSDRKHVKLIRKENNVNKIYNLDLTSKNILTSDKLYIKSNDVLIVDVRKSKILQENLRLFSTYAGIVSLSIALLFRSKQIL